MIDGNLPCFIYISEHIGIDDHLFYPNNFLENPKRLPSYLKKFQKLLDKKQILS